MEYKLILASASPRRQQLMRDAGFHFDVRLKEIKEVWPSELDSRQVAEYLAILKATAFVGELADDELLITADTIVCLDAKILGKPKNREDAIQILKEISGRKHTVITGVCLTTVTHQQSFSSHTDVYFKELTDDEIRFYVDTYKPFDKAGAYGIQEWIGYIGIKKIEGSFYNVMGLPIQQLYETLNNF